MLELAEYVVYSVFFAYQESKTESETFSEGVLQIDDALRFTSKEEIKDRKVDLTALVNHGNCFEYPFDVERRDIDFIREANNNCFCNNYVDGEYFIVSEIIMKAAKQNGAVLEHGPG